jgi:hypothetical protein
MNKPPFFYETDIILEKVEQNCLISNSIKTEVNIEQVLEKTWTLSLSGSFHNISHGVFHFFCNGLQFG